MPLDPALKRRAIVGHPSGTQKAFELDHAFRRSLVLTHTLKRCPKIQLQQQRVVAQFKLSHYPTAKWL